MGDLTKVRLAGVAARGDAGDSEADGRAIVAGNDWVREQPTLGGARDFSLNSQYQELTPLQKAEVGLDFLEHTLANKVPKEFTGIAEITFDRAPNVLALLGRQ
mgnify:CR=1 FL=1